MKLQYEDLLSGEPVFVKGLGHLRSPFLRELKPTSGIGIWTYHFYLQLLLWDRSEYVHFLKLTGCRGIRLIEHNKKLETFDVVTLIDTTRKLLREAMAFFILENISWEERLHRFVCSSKETSEITGYIDRKNFEEVREAILQMNYVNAGALSKNIKHSSKRSRELWEQAQKYLQKEVKTDKTLSLGNVISKLCAASNGYNLLNIFDLTVYQLYDQFFQISYLKTITLNERVFSNHGGKEFKIDAWLEPIMK